MSAPNAKQMIPTLTRWRSDMLDAERAVAACIAFGLQVEAPTIEAIWSLQRALTESIAHTVGDTAHDWLDWYWHENKLGHRGQAAAAPGGKLRPVRTVAQLARLIVASREAPPATADTPADPAGATS